MTKLFERIVNKHPEYFQARDWGVFRQAILEARLKELGLE